MTAPTRPPQSTASRVLLGDWSRTVRDPLDVIRILLVVAAAVLLVRRGLDAGTLTMTLVKNRKKKTANGRGSEVRFGAPRLNVESRG